MPVPRLGALVHSPTLRFTLPVMLENTLTTSPKKLPYINPQKTVLIPQKKNIRRDLRIGLSIFRNFRRQKAQAAAIIMP